MTLRFDVRDFSAGYRAPIVEGVTFSIAAGELAGLLGRNGEGKTTLLRGVTGDARRFRGQALVNGQDLSRLSARARAGLLAALPQRTVIPPGITAREMIRLGCYPRQALFSGPTRAQLALADRAAAELGITHLLDTDCARLSAGQQQLVLLCRMLVQDAGVLLLDEPSAALDYDNTQRLFRLLQDIVRRQNKAGVVVLHDPDTALRWCDRLLILSGGHLARDLPLRGASAGEIQAALQTIYPQLQVGENPYTKGFFCYPAPG